jgi:hypothetical protein
VFLGSKTRLRSPVHVVGPDLLRFKDVFGEAIIYFKKKCFRVLKSCLANTLLR